jgi:hypothetical protein
LPHPTPTHFGCNLEPASAQLIQRRNHTRASSTHLLIDRFDWAVDLLVILTDSDDCVTNLIYHRTYILDDASVHALPGVKCSCHPLRTMSCTRNTVVLVAVGLLLTYVPFQAMGATSRCRRHAHGGVGALVPAHVQGAVHRSRGTRKERQGRECAAFEDSPFHAAGCAAPVRNQGQGIKPLPVNLHRCLPPLSSRPTPLAQLSQLAGSFSQEQDQTGGGERWPGLRAPVARHD